MRKKIGGWLGEQWSGRSGVFDRLSPLAMLIVLALTFHSRSIWNAIMAALVIFFGIYLEIRHLGNLAQSGIELDIEMTPKKQEGADYGPEHDQ